MDYYRLVLLFIALTVLNCVSCNSPNRTRTGGHSRNVTKHNFAKFGNISTTYPKLEPDSTSYDNDGTDPKYPYQEIENYFNSHPKEKKFFVTSSLQIGLRGGWSDSDEEEGENLCKVRRNQYYAPQILPNIWGETKTIVNHAQYQQFIETERCVQPNVSDFKCANLRAGFNSVCHQNYKGVKLAFFNSTMGIGFDLFRIPACCICKLKPIT